MLAHHDKAEPTPDTLPTSAGDPEATQLLEPSTQGQTASRVPTGKPNSRRMWEQRRNVRYPCEMDVRCQGEEPETSVWWSAKARNVSIGGIRLLTGRRVEPGTVLQVELPCPTGAAPMRLVAQVVHLAPTRYGAWVLGCAFERRLDTAELHNLIG